VNLRSDGGPFGTCPEGAPPNGTCQEERSKGPESGARDIGTIWHVTTIGQRIRALREARGANQDQFARLSNGALTRTYVNKLENDPSNRGHRSTALQEGIKGFAGVSLEDAKLFIAGKLGPKELLERGTPPPLDAAPAPAPADAPTREVEYLDDEVKRTWKRVRPIVAQARLKRGADEGDVLAALESVDADAFYASDVDRQKMDEAWWKEQFARRYREVVEEANAATADHAGVARPIGKSTMGARAATEIDDGGGGLPDPDEPPPAAQKGTSLVAGVTAPRSASPPKTHTRPCGVRDSDDTLPVPVPGKVTGVKKTR
jgi:transcriptional regulator with XRE-family HTH domain